jgi:hypothetical protein
VPAEIVWSCPLEPVYFDGENRIGRACPVEGGVLVQDAYDLVTVGPGGDIRHRFRPPRGVLGSAARLRRAGAPLGGGGSPGGPERVAWAGADGAVWIATPTGEGIVRAELGANAEAPLVPLVDGGLLALSGATERRLTRVAPDGSLRWSVAVERGGGVALAPTVDAFGDVLVPTSDGVLWLSGADGSPLARAGGGLACRTAIQLAPFPLVAAWDGRAAVLVAVHRDGAVERLRELGDADPRLLAGAGPGAPGGPSWWLVLGVDDGLRIERLGPGGAVAAAWTVPGGGVVDAEVLPGATLALGWFRSDGDDEGALGLFPPGENLLDAAAAGVGAPTPLPEGDPEGGDLLVPTSKALLRLRRGR